MKKKLRQHFSLLAALVFTGGILLQVLAMQKTVHAAPIARRNLTLQAGAADVAAPVDGLPDGGSAPSGVVNHLFSFDISNQTFRTIKLEYCTTAAPVTNGIQCDPPTGLSLTSRPATFGLGNGDATLNSLTNVSANVAVFVANTDQTVSNNTAPTPGPNVINLRIDNIVNPSAYNETFFVRISTHISTDGTGPDIDYGTVAASTARPIVLTGIMPESLVFCTGETVGKTGGVPDCTQTSDGNIEFDRLFNPNETALATSQMAASTNAGNGYSITVNGPTLTSGSNTILPMANANSSDPPAYLQYGVSQFGMNLVKNEATGTIPASPTPLPVPTVLVGDDIDLPSNTTNRKAKAATNYDVPDYYKYYTGNVVAASNDGGAGGSDLQIYTVSYVVNVPGSQPAGGYATTLTYICTGLF